MGKRGVNSNLSDTEKTDEKRSRHFGKLKKANKTKKPRREYRSIKQAFRETREKIWNKKRARVKYHYSFKRSYREEYKRNLPAPGLVSHALMSLKILFRNWKIFGLLIIVTVIANILLVGLLSEESYKTLQDSLDMSAEINNYGELGRFAKSGLLLISSITTGGLGTSITEVQGVLLVFFVATLWLITTYFLRHILVGNRPRFRDGLYNAFAPLISVFVILAVVAIHLIPFFIFLIVYSVATSTEFLTQPIYAFLFWLLGSLLIILSLYLLPVSLIALSSVTVPGIYPMQALYAAMDVIQSRRIRYITRVVFMLIFLALMWVIIMLPITWLDLFLKEEMGWLVGFPLVPICLQLMIAFSIVYVTTYLYLFYRRMLDAAD